MLYVFKLLLSSAIIATSTEVAKRSPALGGMILALPLVSIISYAIMGIEGADATVMSSYAKSTLIFVPISLVFFLPFVIPFFQDWSFIAKFLVGLGALTLFTYIATRKFVF